MCGLPKHPKPVGIRLVEDVPSLFDDDDGNHLVDGIRCVTYDQDDPYIYAIPNMLTSFGDERYVHGPFEMSQRLDRWRELSMWSVIGRYRVLICRLQKMLDDGEVAPVVPGRMSEVLSSSHAHAKVMDLGSLASGLFLAAIRSNSPTLMYGALKVIDVMLAISPIRLADRVVFLPEHMTETASEHGEYDRWADLDDVEAPFAFYSLIGPKSYGRMMHPEDNDDFVIAMYPLSCDGYWKPGSERALIPDSSTDADMERFIDGTGDCIAVGLTGNNPRIHDLNSGSIVLARQAWPLITGRIWTALADMVASGSPTGFMVETMKGMLHIHDEDDGSED